MSEPERPKSLRDVLVSLNRKLEQSIDRKPGSVAEALDRAAGRLAGAGVDAPRRSAELLAERAFGLSRLGLIVRKKDELSPEQLSAFDALVERRAAGEPVAYLLGEKEFYGLPFAVSPAVLIPRPETELLVDEAKRLFPAEAPVRFADFGTGSGALAVALAHEFPRSQGVAIDASPAALEVARANAEANGVADRLEFVPGDFTQALVPDASLDFVVANPPYVTEAEYAELSPEVAGFEPREALVSPDNGLAHIRGLAATATLALKPGGTLFCEFGSSQGQAVLELLRDPALGFAQVEILRDLAGLDRVAKARKA